VTEATAAMIEHWKKWAMVAACLLPNLLCAQGPTDLQARSGLQIEKDFRKGFGLALNYQSRFDHNWQRFSGSYFSATPTYKLSDLLRAEAEVRFATSHQWDKLRFGIGITAKTELGPLQLSAKLRYQHEFFFQALPEIGQFPTRNQFRLKLQAEYKPTKYLKLYLACEPRYRIETHHGQLQRVRNIVGVDWEFMKRHHIDVSYYYQPEFSYSQTNTNHIFLLNYCMEIQKAKKKKKKKD
jgi:hypothetical protein